MAGKPSKTTSKKPKATPNKVSRAATKTDEPSRGKKQTIASATKSIKSSQSSPATTTKKTSTRPTKSNPSPSVPKDEKIHKASQTPVSAKSQQPELSPEPTPATPHSTPPNPTKKTKNPKPLSAAFIAKQKARLLALKDNLLDTMQGVARDSLRSRPEGSEASAFGMHQADAGSDSYDRDFALSILSQEQDSLYEIDEALKRIEFGTYGICEMSGKPIPQERLEALPFTRYTVECQAELEKRNRYQKIRRPSQPLFAPPDENSDESEEEFSDTKE